MVADVNKSSHVKRTSREKLINRKTVILPVLGREQKGYTKIARYKPFYLLLWVYS